MNYNIIFSCNVHTMRDGRKWLVGAGDDGTLTTWQIDNIKPQQRKRPPESEFVRPAKRFKAHKSTIYCSTLLSEYLVTGGAYQIKLWRTDEIFGDSSESGIPKAKWTGTNPQDANKNGGLDSLTETNGMDSPEHGRLLTATGAPLALEWDLTTGKIVRRFTGHQGYLHGISCLNTHIFATAAEDATCKIWDRRQKGFVCSFDPVAGEEGIASANVKDWVSCVSGHPNGRNVAVGCSSSKCPLSIWDIAARKCVHKLSYDWYTPQCVSFQPDFSVITAENSPTVRIFETSDQSTYQRSSLKTSIKSVWCLVRTDTYWIASGSSPLVDLLLPKPFFSTFCSLTSAC